MNDVDIILSDLPDGKQAANSILEHVLTSEEANPVPRFETGLSPSLPAEDVSPLFRDQETKRQKIKTEKAIHRNICLMHLSGAKNIEIAEALGVTKATVGNVINQEWAREFMARHLSRRERTFAEALDEQIMPSFDKLIEIRDGNTASEETKRKVCEGIIARKYGAFTQPIVTTQVKPEEMTDAQIDARLAELRKQN